MATPNFSVCLTPKILQSWCHSKENKFPNSTRREIFLNIFTFVSITTENWASVVFSCRVILVFTNYEKQKSSTLQTVKDKIKKTEIG